MPGLMPCLLIQIRDDEDEDVQVLASHRARAMAARQEAEQMLEGAEGTRPQPLRDRSVQLAGMA
jgi:hypothetical protein